MDAAPFQFDPVGAEIMHRQREEVRFIRGAINDHFTRLESLRRDVLARGFDAINLRDTSAQTEMTHA